MKRKKKTFELNPQKTLGIKGNKNMAPKNALGPSFFTPLVCGVVSGVVQVSVHEVRKPMLVMLRTLHSEKEGEELFC